MIKFNKKDFPFAYLKGNNPYDENSNYYCLYCDLQLYGEETGFVSAGINYANGEYAPCPACGTDNYIQRLNEDE